MRGRVIYMLDRIRCLSVFLCFMAVYLTGAHVLHSYTRPPTDTVSGAPATAQTYVIDAGHGGEDGGAVRDGVFEKDLNLDVALRLGALLEASGARVVYTRTEDCALYDEAVPGQHRRRDLAHRLRCMQENLDAVFISIHMNCFSDSRYDGLQVFYSANHPESRQLASTLQQFEEAHLDTDNTRKAKVAGSNIFLLQRAEGIAVLVECGFLSNDAELAKLSSAPYRSQLALTLCAGLLEYQNEKEEQKNA